MTSEDKQDSEDLGTNLDDDSLDALQAGANAKAEHAMELKRMAAQDPHE